MVSAPYQSLSAASASVAASSSAPSYGATMASAPYQKPLLPIHPQASSSSTPSLAAYVPNASSSSASSHSAALFSAMMAAASSAGNRKANAPVPATSVLKASVPSSGATMASASAVAAPVIQKYKLINRTTLRLQNDSRDPNGPGNEILNGHQFKGNTITTADRLIFPNGEPGATGLVLVVDRNNPNNLGYVRQKYLQPIGSNSYRLILPTVTLRLQDNIADPNDPKNKNLKGTPFKGPTIDSTAVLSFPSGQHFPSGGKQYVIVQKDNDRNIFGYVNATYIESAQQKGGDIYYNKYLKYKNKYLKYKNSL
jgi:hypothetical protein